jgi:hypothetical protein
MLKVYYLISMLHGAPDVARLEIGPFDSLNKCAHVAIALIQNAPTFQTYCEQREAKVSKAESIPE